MPSTKVGFLLWPQTASWPEIRDAAALADRSGATSLWTWDHLNSIVGPWEGPILEGWSILSGWSQVTERATLGLMVAANTFRNPGLTAKLATTLDHLSGGRAVLGLGGAWFEREHDAYGIDFGSGFGERLDRLDEATMLVRRLLDGELVTHDGPIYPMHDALVAPRPVQVRLPIMIGGSGPKKTLRTLARYGDQWNSMGDRRQARASATRSCASTAPRSGATTRRSSGRPRSTSSSATRTRPGSPTTGRSSPPTGRSSTPTGTSSSARRPRSPRASSRSSSSGSATS